MTKLLPAILLVSAAPLAGGESVFGATAEVPASAREIGWSVSAADCSADVVYDADELIYGGTTADVDVDAAVASVSDVIVPDAAQSMQSSQRAETLLGKLAAGFRTMGNYGVEFEVASDTKRARGNYTVAGERYHLVLGDGEVFCDGEVRYEVDNHHREVTIDKVDKSSRNILNNPVRAFDFVGSEYVATLVSEANGRAVIQLVPAKKNESVAVNILLTIDTETMRPLSLSYDYEGEKVVITVLSVAPVKKTIKNFDKSKYTEYELIDFL